MHIQPRRKATTDCEDPAALRHDHVQHTSSPKIPMPWREEESRRRAFSGGENSSQQSFSDRNTKNQQTEPKNP